MNAKFKPRIEDADDDGSRAFCRFDRPPPDIVATRIDFAARLKSLGQRKRSIAKVLASGETTNAAARKAKSVREPIIWPTNCSSLFSYWMNVPSPGRSRVRGTILRQ